MNTYPQNDVDVSGLVLAMKDPRARGPQALKDMRLMPGVLEVCEYLDSLGVPRGLITSAPPRPLFPPFPTPVLHLARSALRFPTPPMCNGRSQWWLGKVQIGAT